MEADFNLLLKARMQACQVFIGSIGIRAKSLVASRSSSLIGAV